MRSKRSFGRKRRVARRKVHVRKTARRKSRRMSNTGFPSRKTILLKYVETFRMDLAAAATGGAYLFKANDVYDPNYSSTGHQPLGHDYWAAIYKNYEVLSSTCTFTVQQPAPQGSSLGNFVVYAKVLDEPTASTTVDTVLEQPGIKRATLQSGGGSGSKCRLKLSYRKRGRFPGTVDGRTQMNTSPAEPRYFMLGLQSLHTTLVSATADPGDLFCMAEIYFKVRVDTLRIFSQA